MFLDSEVGSDSFVARPAKTTGISTKEAGFGDKYEEKESKAAEEL